MKNYLQQLLRIGTIFIMLFTTVEIKSQVNITSKFKGFTYEELLRPVQMATEAYKEAEEDVEEAYIKATYEIENSNYKMALFYFEKCSRINARFNYNICDQKKLNSYISYVQQMENQKDLNTPIRLNNSITIPLLRYNNPSSDKIIELPKDVTIIILEKKDNEVLIKVKYEDYIGYIPRAWLNYK